MLKGIQEATLSHAKHTKILEGTKKSHYRPTSLASRIFFYENFAKMGEDGMVDCEDITRLIAKTIGRTRVTPELRILLLELESRMHQYSKSGEVALSTYLAGRSREQKVSVLLQDLEKAGVIRLVNGYWRGCPGDRSLNIAPKYWVDPSFAQALNLMYLSVKHGRTTKSYGLKAEDVFECAGTSGPLVDSSTDAPMPAQLLEISSHPSSSSSYIRPMTLFREILAKLAQNLEKSYRYLFTNVSTKSTRPTPLWRRKRRDAKLSLLWRGMSAKDLEGTGVLDKICLTCHSTGIGPEVSRVAIKAALSDKYRVDLWEKIVSAVDSHLPPRLRQRLFFNIREDRHGNVFGLSCRPYSALCGTPNEGNTIKNAEILEKNGELRINMLDAAGIPHENHFDAHCSIFNIAYALAHGIFENKDFYSAVALRLSCPRNIVKLAFMKGNFGIFAAICAAHKNSGIPDKPVVLKLKGKEGVPAQRIQLPFTYRQLQDAMFAEGLAIQGTSTEVFLHEAFIYDLVRYYLWAEREILSTRVFDSIYTGVPVSETEFISLINRAVTDYSNILAHNDALLSIRL